MMRTTRALRLIAFIAASGLAISIASAQAPTDGAPRQAFATINGVRLHHADWGGTDRGR